MPRHFHYIILFLLLGLVACKNEPAEEQTNIPETATVDTTEAFRERFRQKLKGSWVLTDYLEAIKKTKSPGLATRSYDTIGLVEMLIKDNPAADSILIYQNWNNHEGGQFTAYFIPGEQPNSLPTNLTNSLSEVPIMRYEVGYETVYQTTNLILYEYLPYNKKVRKWRYTKVSDTFSEEDFTANLRKMIHEQVVAGTYTLVDGQNVISNVRFAPDGKLSGFPGYESYEIFYDYGNELETSLNIVNLIKSRSSNTCFAYVIKNDTINFHSVVMEYEHFASIGPLVYKLIRKK